MPVGWELERPELLEEAEILALLLRETDRSVLAFALYRSVADREAAVRFLKEHLPLPVLEFTLSAQRRNPVDLLRQAPAGQRTCIFFYDVEEALPELTGYVNLQREAFAEVPHATVFWVREYSLREIAAKAPDFWSWRSGVFDFRLERRELPAPLTRAAAFEPLLFRDRGDLDRRISLYQGLIREYSVQEKPDERFLARLELKLSYALYLLARFDEAEAWARRALERSKRIPDRALEARALYRLGTLALERSRLDEAETLSRQGLAIAEVADDESLVVAGYHNLGIVAQERQRLDEAEQWCRKALEICERLGVERDAADEYHQLGNVAYFRRRLDEAEEWYRKALGIFERLSLERDANDEYHHLGMVAQARQRFDEAEQWYRKALDIVERLGLEREAARTYHQLGMLAQERQRFDEAEQWYHRALEIFNRLVLPQLAVKTLAGMGVLRRAQNRLPEAVRQLGMALDIASSHDIPVAAWVLRELARLSEEMGEAAFTAAWREAFPGQEPPLDLLGQVLEATPPAPSPR